MTSDKNKIPGAVNSIVYNFMNLPSQVTKGIDVIKYIYDAQGRKLSQLLYAGATLKKTSDYLDELYYENDTLKLINHEEGRIVVNMAAPEYQYVIKDHLGNTRVTFTS